jgi:S1-C subfamily serine protease
MQSPTPHPLPALPPPAAALKSYFITCVAILLPLLLCVGIFSSVKGYGLADLLQGKQIPKDQLDKAAVETGSVSAAMDKEFEQLAATVMPGVVSVDTTKENAFSRLLVEKKNHYRELPGTQFDPPTSGIGSGVIVSKEGHILTCWHVLKGLDLEHGRDVCSVRLHGEREAREVDLIGKDERTDLAVLKLRKLPEQELTVLPMGDSDLMRRGNLVMAVGSPFGLYESVSQGILSNCDRKIGVSDLAMPHFQTDCVINPGNSGGPLVNLKGEVIGINWAIYSGEPEVHSWQGIGLVVRSNEAKAALESILHQSGPRPYLGLGFDEAKFDPLTDSHRVYLLEVMQGSPAATAGLMLEDTVDEIDDVPVANMAEAWKRVRAATVGSTVKFKISRGPNLESKTISVTVADLDKASTEPPTMPVKELGITAKDCNDMERYTYKFKLWNLGDNFVIVTDVDAQGPLAEQLKQGDILCSVDGVSQLKTTAELQRYLASRKVKVPFTVWRNGQMFQVAAP